jgi:hypothetical protein
MPQIKLMFIYSRTFFYHPGFIGKNHCKLSDCPYKKSSSEHKTKDCWNISVRERFVRALSDEDVREETRLVAANQTAPAIQNATRINRKVRGAIGGSAGHKCT